MRYATLSSGLRLAGPCLVVVLATVLQSACHPQLNVGGNSFFFFIPAVLLVAWFGGFGPGLLATLLSILVIDYLFLTPRTLFFNLFSENLWLGVMTLGGTAFSFLSGFRRKARHRLHIHLRQQEAIASRVRHQAQQEQARLHASVEQQRQLFLAVADNATMSIAIFDGGDLCLKWNNAAFGKIITSRGDHRGLAGRTLTEIIPGAREKGILDIFRATAATGQPCINHEFEFRGDSGSLTYWYWVLRPLPAEAGGIPDLLLLTVDITDEVLARQKIEQHAAQAQANLDQLQAIVGSMNEGLTIADQDGRILLMNPAALRMLGFGGTDDDRPSLAELNAIFEIRTLEGLLLAPADWPLARALRGESFAGVELQVRRLDAAHYMIASISGSAVRDAAGRILLAVQSMRDVTRQKEAEVERRRLEQDLRQHAAELASMNQAKDEFLAMLSHELRNPLAPIASALHIMEAHENGKDAAMRRAMGIVERQTGHLAHLLDDLLDASRITRGRIALKTGPLDLVRAVRHAVEDRRAHLEGSRHTLVLRLPPAPVWVEADPARLEQIIVNLLGNAVKYTPSGGEIEIALSVCEPEARLEVRDNGIGIAPEMLPRIFDLFIQADSSLDRSQGGLGIGLTLVRRLTEMHGGTIEARSEGPGCGSRFIVTLPLLAPSAAAALPVPAAAAPVVPAVRRVLIVEDNTDTAQAMGEMLELWGHEVRLAYDGPGALDVALAYHPDVILLDIGLPGMDGYQVSRVLREDPRFAATRIIAITGYGQDDDISQARAVGIDLHFTKPVDLHALRQALDG